MSQPRYQTGTFEFNQKGLLLSNGSFHTLMIRMDLAKIPLNFYQDAKTTAYDFTEN